MYANLKSYHQAIDRANAEIANIELAIRKVSQRKTELEKDTEKILELQRSEMDG
jgi:hypothetical protein